jgi:3-deoxy-7-phosphoheptulonate synthase
LSEGNGSVILCERGIRTFENATRFTLDLGSIARAKKESHLPVCADPSHAAGARDLVMPLALSSVAAGSDMLLVEVHPNPEAALSDGKQQITVKDLEKLTNSVKALQKAIRV